MKYGPNHAPTIYIEHEPGSSGVDAYKYTARKLAGYVVYPDRPTGKKEVRAEPWASQCAAGNVYLIEDGSWDILEWIKEHCLFPKISKKDRVDSASGAFGKLAKFRTAGTLRVLSTKMKKGSVRIIVSTLDRLEGIIIDDHPALLVCIQDPDLAYPDQPLPLHALSKLQEGLILSFADLDPANLQDKWDKPIEPWGLPPEKVIMTQDNGKALWRLLTKKRDVSNEAIVVVDAGDNRALSVAYGICDTMRLPRSSTIWREGIEGDWKATDDDKPPNAFIHAMTKSSRSLVI